LSIQAPTNLLLSLGDVFSFSVPERERHTEY
jgi:hypothetical protein